MNIKVKLGIGVVILVIIAIIVVVCTLPSSAKANTDGKLRPIFLLGTNTDKVLYYDYDSKEVKHLLTNTAKGISSFVSYYNETIYYAPRKPNDAIYSSSKTYKHLRHHTREWTKTAMAVDHVTEKLYVLDRPAGNIHVVDIHNSYNKIIMSNLVDPMDMVIDVAHSTIFILHPTSISQFRIGKDSVPDVIVESANLQAFTVDLAKQIVYYSDGRELMSYNYRRRVDPKTTYGAEHNYDYQNQEKSSPFYIPNVISLSFARNHLFLIENRTNSPNRTLFACDLDKETWQEGSCKLEKLYTSPDLEKIQFYNVNPLEPDNFCNINGHCDQLCITRLGACACTVDWRLGASGECYPSDKLYANLDNDSIAEYNFEKKIFTDALLDSDWSIKSFDLYDSTNVIYATTRPGEQIRCSNNACGVPSSTGAWTNSGLAVDRAYKNLYVVDEIDGYVNVTRINSLLTKTLLTGLNKPKDIVLDPQSALMFIQEESAVQKAEMDGSKVEKIYNMTGISAIAVDTRNKKLYVAIPEAIVSIDYRRKSEPRQIASLNNTEISSLTVLNEHLFAVLVTYEGKPIDKYIKSCHLVSDYEPCEFKLVHGNDNIVNIKSKLEAEEVETPCSKDNGGCEHFCLRKNNAKRFVCECNDKYQKKNESGKETCELIRQE